MSIQEIAVSNNQKKNILLVVKKQSIVFQDDNGDVVVNVEAYQAFKKGKDPAPIEHIVGTDVLDYSAEYFIFSS